MPSWLLVASGQDASALWAWRVLGARGHRCEVVLTEALELPDVHWRHRVATGGADVEITLSDGRRLKTGDFDAVLNRVITPPLTLLARMGWEDSAYARSEQIAFSISWLRALAPLVINPPAARGIAGAWRSALEWRVQARTAGFEVEPLRVDSRDPQSLAAFPLTPPDVLVLGEEAFGAASPSQRAAAVRLARATGTPILGLWLTDSHAPRLTMATPHPDLTLGGEAGVDALERLLAA